MTIRNEPWPPGTPCWVDLTAPDVSEATGYYREVLGWEFTEPDAAYGGYVIAHVDGAAAAGVGPVHGEGRPAWTLYLAVTDADRAAEAVSTAGGTILLSPTDVGPLGRMFVAADPTGAVFGCWQAGAHIGAGVVNEPGGLTWEDLRSTDPVAAKAFYHKVFGYSYQDLPGGGSDYGTVHLAPGLPPVGGMGGMLGVPGTSHWLVYFAVPDTDAALAAAATNGGAVLAPAFDSPFGRIAVLADPGGAGFAVITPATGTSGS